VRGWDAVYAGRPPWDIGRPQPAFRDLADAGELRGRVLDVGCGTGEHTLMAAALGLDATGIDITVRALAIAREKATERALDARFLAWDATQLPILGERWQTVLDSGVFHVFDDAARARYVAALAAVVEPGGRYHLLVFSDRQGGSLGPRRITEAEIRGAFVHGWSIRSIEPAIMQTTTGFDPGPGRGPGGAQAWLATIERR
jgi:ubiquinone/menaquinone biosynthesis C-methylase UbiE